MRPTPAQPARSRVAGPRGPVRRVVVVGGVAGGMSAATRLRRLDEHLEIVVLERSGHVSFANCGLPYHVGGVIPERDALLLQTPESLGARFALDVRVRHEVTAIDRERRLVMVRDLDAEGEEPVEHPVHYDALVLSPGARPVVPPVPGIDRGVTLRDIEDTDRLTAAVHGASSAVVIGGGFVGLEVAENLVHRGLDVAVVEASAQVMAPLDPEMVAPVHDRIRECGVRLFLSNPVAGVGPREVTLADGRSLAADVVVVAVGVRPESRLAAEADLEVGPCGGIAVDESFRTSDPDIYAVGDAVEKRDAVDGVGVLVPLANTANRQGRLVADAIAGRPAADRPVLGTAIVGVFGLQVATTGWSEKRLRAAGRRHHAIHTHPFSHATYYPGADTMALKLLVDPETDAILGAQGVGGAGVDKRIDVLATAIAGGLPASALTDLELAYAPAFGSAKDPVNMLGYVAMDRADGLGPAIQWHEIRDGVSPRTTLVDVRTEAEHRAGAIPGSLHIPVDELRKRVEELPLGPLLVYCQVGIRGHVATRVLAQHGHEVANLDGGYRTWLAGSSAGGAAALR